MRALRRAVKTERAKYWYWFSNNKQEGQHPLTGQRVANFRLLAKQ